jgi:hypothetical protein
MAGGRHRSVASVYQRHPPIVEPPGAREEQPGPSDKRTQRRGRGGRGGQSSSRQPRPSLPPEEVVAEK